MSNVDFECALAEHLRKCELEYRAKKMPHGSFCEWLAGFCGSTESICLFLRSLGFRIKDIVDCDGAEWVETTSGVLVFVNWDGGSGFVAGKGK